MSGILTYLPLCLRRSNWSIPNLKIILDKAEVVPAANQVELHPYVKHSSCPHPLPSSPSCHLSRYNPQHELVKFCQEKKWVPP